MMGSCKVPAYVSGTQHGRTGRVKHTFARSIQRPHVKDVNAFHLTQNFQALEPGGLFDIGGHSTRGGTGREKVAFGMHVYQCRQQLGSDFATSLSSGCDRIRTFQRRHLLASFARHRLALLRSGFICSACVSWYNHPSSFPIAF